MPDNPLPPGKITGWAIHDDGADNDPPEERFWGETFVCGVSDQAAMGATFGEVKNQLREFAREALK